MKDVDMVKLLYWAGCTALAGENNYSRNPLPGSYLGSSEESGVYTFELQGICSFKGGRENVNIGVYTFELQGICSEPKNPDAWDDGVYTFELQGICSENE